MDIHEYQAKKILAGFGVAVPRGGIVYSPENAENKANGVYTKGAYTPNIFQLNF